MTQSSSSKTVRRGRVFPEKQLSPEEKARIKAEDAVFYKRCREVFDRVQPELIEDHYDGLKTWTTSKSGEPDDQTLEPCSGKDYIISEFNHDYHYAFDQI